MTLNVLFWLIRDKKAVTRYSLTPLNENRIPDFALKAKEKIMKMSMIFFDGSLPFYAGMTFKAIFAISHILRSSEDL